MAGMRAPRLGASGFKIEDLCVNLTMVPFGGPR
jgi:hypothetical protein